MFLQTLLVVKTLKRYCLVPIVPKCAKMTKKIKNKSLTK